MSLSIQTNVASLEAQNAIRINTQFQSDTIQQLSSGYRINSSADDAAGLAVANQYRGDTAVLTQGVMNANNGIAGLQIADGGLSNISTIVDRLRTLATESASTTFTGSRVTLNNEYQGLLAEVDRQAANINLNTGGTYNSNLVTYVGGGNNSVSSQTSVNLSGANNAVDTAGLGIAGTSILGGGSELSDVASNVIRLDNAATTFLTGNSQTFNFHIGVAGVGGAIANQDVGIVVNGGANGLTGTQVVSSLNSSLSQYGITASIASDGTLQFGSSNAFSVQAAAATGGNAAATTNAAATNTATYNVSSASGAGAAVFADFTGTQSETAILQNATGSTTVTLDSTNADTIDHALTYLNTQLSGTGISAVKDELGTSISFQSDNSFSANETAQVTTGAGNLFGGVGAVNVTGPAVGATGTGSSIQALALLATAVTNLGLVQGTIGAGINKLNYAVNLAQSQITNYSAAEAGIRDANVAAEAANLTKAQVLQQASLAALAQANSAPQAVLALLKGQ
ncbi:MAG TPA: flagellin [Bryobacteraceae bacterium]|jgi:flagellin|nr:flagellin [Bryobacteraceae bacterium]